jgi:hypothetical protein
MNVLTSTAIRTETAIRFARARRHSAELTARASEWHSLAARLEQRAAVWSDECSEWAEQRDHRATSSSFREQWVAEQTRQLAGWLRLAAEHLLTLAANEAP